MNAPSNNSQTSLESHRIKIGGMSCSFCVETIRKTYKGMEGVHEVHVSLAHEEALIRYDPQKIEPPKLEETLRQVGYTVRDPDKTKAFHEQEEEIRLSKRKLKVAGIFTAIAAILMIAMWIGAIPEDFLRPLLLTVMPVVGFATVFGPGWYIVRKAYFSIRRGILNQHVLLEFAALAALLGGVLGLVGALFDIGSIQFPAPAFFGVATFLAAYHILSEYTSLHVRVKASRSVQKLMELQPDTARVVRDGKTEEVPVDELNRGDRVQVKPGESIPVDGQIEEGRSGIDESIVTGESMPVDKGEGDEVVGGSVNQTGSLTIGVTKVGEESFLQQVSRQIEEARAMKPGILQLVDVVLKYYVPGVIAFAVFAFLIWTVGAWIFTGEMDVPRAIFATLAVFVLGYPCALGMATPLAMIRGGGMAAEKGILMRSGEAFHVIKDLKKVVLDKTGTITRGKPQVTDVIAYSDNENKEELLHWAASVEAPSEHPLGAAIVNYAKEKEIEPAKVTDFEAMAGKGVRATLDGRTLLAGNPGFFAKEFGADLTAARADLDRLQNEAKTAILIGEQKNGKISILGLTAIADTVKDDAKETIDRLRQRGLEAVMVTGDNEPTARSVANGIDIESFLAEVLPDQKAEHVRKLQEEGHRVAFVGDGINDAPALMQADVGLVVGAGTDIAIESADVVLTGEGLSGIDEALEIGKNSYRKTVQNLWLAFAFNGIGVPAATTGLVHPIWAMIAMVASVTAVLANSFGGRLLAKRKPARQREEAPAGTQKITLRSKAIGGQCCVDAIKKAVGKIDGVESAGGDPQTKKITITYSTDQTGSDEIRSVMRNAGYPPVG